MNKLFNPDMEKCRAIAERIFISSFGMDRSGKKYDRMRRDAFEMLEKIESMIFVKGAYEYFSNVKFKGRTLSIDNYMFECNVFEKINSETIKGVYVYALSAGDYSCPEEEVKDQLYADMWGNAFADAGRIMLRELLEEKNKLGDSFGPGFYGMDIMSMGTVSKIIDFPEIGIELRNNKILLPLKACVGIIPAVNDDYEMMNKECLYCKGTHKSCSLCNIHERSYKND